MSRRFSETDHDCDDGGIVANNPTNPDAASMEVTDTRLINLPEKTKFNVNRVIEAPPPPPPGGRLAEKLVLNNLQLVNPDLGPLIGDDGKWNGSEEFSFRFAQLDPNTGPPPQPTGVVYSSLHEVPGLSQAAREDMATKIEFDYKPTFINRFLKTLTSQNTRMENIFQLDPNQLLTVSGGYKMVLRRPISGFFETD